MTVSATEDLGAKAADMAAMLVHDYGLRAFQYALIDGGAWFSREVTESSTAPRVP